MTFNTSLAYAVGLMVGIMMMSGCSTVVTKYTYDDRGNAVPVERIRLRGIGEAKVSKDEYEISSEPWVKIPELPKLEFEKD